MRYLMGGSLEAAWTMSASRSYSAAAIVRWESCELDQWPTHERTPGQRPEQAGYTNATALTTGSKKLFLISCGDIPYAIVMHF